MGNDGSEPGGVLTAFGKTVLVAGVVAALVTLLVLGLRGSPKAAYPAPDQGLSVASGTHFSGPLIVAGGIQAGNNLTTTGNLVTTVGGLVNSQGAVTVTDDLRVTGNVDAANAVGLRLNDDVLVTGTLGVSSQVNAGNGLNVTGGITFSGDLDVAGNIKSTSGSVRVNDDTLITGTLAVAGNLSDSSTMLRVNDNTLITGTLGVSSQINAAGGVYATGGVTATGMVAAGTDLMGVGWLVVAPRAELAITDYITPTGSVQPINASLWATPTLNVSTAVAGSVLILINTGTENIYMQDLGSLLMATDFTMAQWDTLTLYNDGTYWIELSRSVNVTIG
jgi:cytoskeletal protein CcmA (bactofilin family)